MAGGFAQWEAALRNGSAGAVLQNDTLTGKGANGVDFDSQSRADGLPFRFAEEDDKTKPKEDLCGAGSYYFLTARLQRA